MKRRKGSNLIYDNQRAGFALNMNFVKGKEHFKETFQKGKDSL